MSAPFLPVLPNGRNPPRRREVLSEAELEYERAMIKSLQIKTDERYAAISHYRDNGGTASSTGHFARLVQTNRKLMGLPEKEIVLGEKSDFNDVSHWDIETQEAAGERAPRQSAACVGDRIEWQESFDHNVRRLLVDFQLSDVPDCRLHHLDRVHEWFEEHGGKQVRKARQAPSYLTVDRSGRMPPGSTKHISSPLSTTSQILSGTFKRKK